MMMMMMMILSITTDDNEGVKVDGNKFFDKGRSQKKREKVWSFAKPSQSHSAILDKKFNLGKHTFL